MAKIKHPYKGYLDDKDTQEVVEEAPIVQPIEVIVESPTNGELKKPKKKATKKKATKKKSTKK